MNHNFLKIGVATFALGLLLWPGCSVSVNTSTTSDSTAVSTPTAPAPEAGLVAGAYCYAFKNETLSLTAELDYDGATMVTGTLWGEIADQANSYFTSYVTEFSGTLLSGRLDVNTRTEIEGDVQQEKASWPWDGKTLTEGDHKMTQVDCEPHE